MIMDTVKICMLAVPALFSLVIVKQWNANFSPLLRVALTVLFGSAAIAALSPILEYLFGLLGTEQTLYATVLFKALGIAVLSHYAAELCRESGEGGLAGGVETLGKIEILLLCIPLMEEILSCAKSLLAQGG